MTSPQLSSQQREQADKIFKNAAKQAWIGIFVFTTLCCVLTVVVAHRIFHVQPNTGWTAGLGMIWLILVPIYATRQVDKAGLSLARTERHFIPRTKDHFEGQQLDVRSPTTVQEGKWGIAVLCVGFGGFIWLLLTQKIPLTVIALIFLVLLVCVLQIRFRLSNPPLLRLDSRGALSSSQHFWGQGIAWPDIKEAELQRMFNYKGESMASRLIFRTTQSRRFVAVPFPKRSFTDQQVDEIAAQVEAALSGISQDVAL